MNRTKIEWTDFSWNPITGCRNGCEFCYARKLAEGRLRGRYGYPEDEPFRPTFHVNKILEPKKIKKPSRIFTVSMGDIFGHGVSKNWVHAICLTMETAPQHTYQILTKCPERIGMYLNGKILKDNVWIGTSVTSKEDQYRVDIMNANLDVAVGGNPKRFISFEPLLGPVNCGDIEWEHLDWIIVGAETGRRANKVEARISWIEDIMWYARKHKIPIFLKPSLKWKSHIQEFPEDNKINKINNL